MKIIFISLLIILFQVSSVQMKPWFWKWRKPPSKPIDPPKSPPVDDPPFKVPPPAYDCICTLQYAPVQCDNGITGSNGCFAACKGGKNCRPAGPATTAIMME